MSRYPISRICPACGGSAFRRVQPETRLAFVSDRICEDCGTRYTPLTPGWAALLFILAGLLALSLGGYHLMARWPLKWPPNTPLLRNPSLQVGSVTMALGVLGILAISHGCRSLLRGRQQTSAEAKLPPKEADPGFQTEQVAQSDGRTVGSLGKKLSRTALRLHLILCFIIWSYLAWGAITHTGLGDTLNSLQADLITGIRSEKFTIILSTMLALLAPIPVAFLWDFVTGQGVFRQRSGESAPDDQHPVQGL
jgi:hypothetical protein